MSFCLLALLSFACFGAKPPKQLIEGKVNSLKLNETITLSGTVHGSVGLDFFVECEETAFDVKREEKLDHPVSSAPGDDGGTVTYKITPKKEGMFTITTYVDFRGDKEDVKKYVVSVKNKNKNKKQNNRYATATRNITSERQV